MKSIKQFITSIFSRKKERQGQAFNQGNVKFFNKTKGFGFITVPGSNEDIFVHKSGLVDSIRKADQVLFNTEKSQKGLQAINVRLA